MKKTLATITIIATLALTVYVETARAAWFDEDWSNRVSITIDSTQVDSTLTDFPVYLDLSDLPSGFHTNVETDGCDIRVVESDETTETAFELVDYDSGSDTGELHFLADSLSSSADTEFYIYYGNSGASCYADSATYGAENVWNSGYLAVWHMNEDPSGTAPQITDSTSNSHDGTSNGSMTSADLVSGNIGNAIDFDGSDDFISFPDVDATTASGGDIVSYQVWTQPDALSNYKGLVQTDSLTGLFTCSDNGWSVQSNGDNAGVCASGTDLVTGGAWHKLTGIFVEGTEYIGYEDGTQVFNPATSDTNAADSGGGRIANRVGGSGDQLDGRIDEVRIKSTEISADWETAEYTNQNTPTTFYTAGTQEDAPAGEDEPEQLIINNGGMKVDNGRVIID